MCTDTHIIKQSMQVIYTKLSKKLTIVSVKSDSTGGRLTEILNYDDPFIEHFV